MSDVRGAIARGVQALRVLFAGTANAADTTPPHGALAPVPLVCALCQQAFAWTAGEQRFFAKHGLRQPTHCRRCVAWRKLPPATRGPAPGTPSGDVARCADCQQLFTIRPTRRAWFVSRGLSLPTRCKWCLQQRRAAGTP